MNTNRLTDAAVRRAKPGAHAIRLFDGGGMYLEVAPSGGKWWRHKFRFGGKEKLLSLGVYPEITLAKVRSRRKEARELLAKHRVFQSRSMPMRSLQTRLRRPSLTRRRTVPTSGP